MVDGDAVEQSLPIVRGRPLLLRVFVAPEAEWQAREVAVRLELTRGGEALPPQEIRRVVDEASVEDDIMSTFAFDVAPEDVTEDTEWSVSIWEAAPGVTGPGSSGGAKFPAEGAQALDAGDAGPPVQVVLVPVRYNADGSGRLPDTSEAQIEIFHDQMMKLYPIPDVEITVHNPIDWSNELQADGGGWGGLLTNIAFRRQNDGVATNVYYYGVFTPASSFFSFCASGGYGCVLGLSNLAWDASDDWARASIGLGYGGAAAQWSAETFAHEVGHAHGRQHAPCQTYDSDPGFPHSQGKIGVWGYDLFEHVLIDPNGEFRDLMGYCQPNWISDYTYNALFQRVRAVNQMAGAYVLVPSTPPARYRVVTVELDGSLSFTASVTLKRAPRGEPRQVTLLDAAGRPSGEVEAWFYPFDHVAGGTLLIAEPPRPASAIRVFGKTLAL
jgi:hypothetical protein